MNITTKMKSAERESDNPSLYHFDIAIISAIKISNSMKTTSLA